MAEFITNYGRTADCVLVAAFILVLVAIGVVDHKKRIIPPSLNAIVAIIAVGRIVYRVSISGTGVLPEHILGGICVPLLLLVIYFFTNGKGIGGGDIKLLSASGLFVGVSASFIAVFIGCVLAVAIYVVKAFMKKAQRTFALGPFFAVGLAITVLFF